MSDALSNIAEAFGNLGAHLALGVGLHPVGHLFGIRVEESWSMPVGRPILTGRAVIAHPLDVNTIRHHDVHARLDGSRDILVRDAYDQLNALAYQLKVDGERDRFVIALHDRGELPEEYATGGSIDSSSPWQPWGEAGSPSYVIPGVGDLP